MKKEKTKFDSECKTHAIKSNLHAVNRHIRSQIASGESEMKIIAIESCVRITIFEAVKSITYRLSISGCTGP